MGNPLQAALARILAGARQGAMAGIGGMPPMGGQGRSPLLARGQAPDPTQTPSPTAVPSQTAGPTPNVQTPQGPVSTTAPPAYSIPKPQPPGAAPTPNAPVPQPHEQINSLAQLILGWKHRDYTKKAAEMQNVWTDLMEAMDALRDPAQAKQAQVMIDTIMERHGKDLAKFFKGRFEEVKKQQTQAGDQKEPDPTEQGLEGALQQKQKEAAQPPSAGGYYLPMAGPEAQLKNAAVNANLAAARLDPQRMLQSQLTSGEMRQQELGAAGLAVTPKMDVELKKAALEVTKFQHEAQKAAAEFLAAQQRLQLGEKVEEGKIDELRLKNQKALTDLDIARQRLARERLKTKGTQQMNQSYRLKFGAIKQAEDAINQLIGSKAGITGENVTNLVNLLKAAGATGIANDLVTQQKTWYKSYSKPEQIRDALQSYKKSFQDAFKLDEMGNTIDEADMEGGADTEPDTDMPEEETPAGYPPGWVQPPATAPKKP